MNSASENGTLVRRAGGIVLLSALLCCGCRQQSNPVDSAGKSDAAEDLETVTVKTGIQFVDVTVDAGIEHTAVNGEVADGYTILESLGSGVAVMDITLDGRPDLFLPGGGTFSDDLTPVGTACRVYIGKDGIAFDERSEAVGISSLGFYAHGAWTLDFNSDGFDDLCVTGYADVALFRGQGDGTFRRLPLTCGLVSRESNTGIAVADVDGDGHVDIYVCRYVNWSPGNNGPCIIDGVREVCSPGSYDGVTDLLFKNEGDGTFTAAPQNCGIKPGGKGLAAMMADVDLDGDADCYVANDATMNRLYLNDGHGRFTENGITAGVAFGDGISADGSMGIDVGDTNNDSLPDLWVCNFENQAFALYRNFGNGFWEHCSEISGITAGGTSYVGFGTSLFDPDADGDLDIVATNGHVMRHGRHSPIQQRALFFENDGGDFRNVASAAGEYFQKAHRGRGLATADFDADGDADLVITALNEPTVILSNTTEQQGDVCELKLVGRASSRYPVGAHVMMTLPDGSEILRLVKSGNSYLSQSERMIRFRVPRGSSDLKIRVNWPGGRNEELILPVTGRFTIVEGRASRVWRRD